MQDKELAFRLIAMLKGDDEIDLRLVDRGLGSTDPPTVLKALRALADNYSPELCESVLGLFLSGTDGIWQMAEQALRQDPLFLFEARFARNEESYDHSRGRLARNHLEPFFLHARIERLSAIIKKYAAGGEERTLTRLARLPGVENFFLERIFRKAGPAALTELRRKIAAVNATAYPPQISIIPSYACNLNCAYCFAKAMIKNNGADMSESFFRRILDTIAVEGKVELVNFLGGEPTQFRELELFAAAAEARGLKYYFATNGLADRDRFSRISAGKNLVSITFHIEKDDFYSPAQSALLLANVQAAARRPIHVVIRYNLTDPERNDWPFMRKYFDVLPTFSFSFAAVFPDIGSRGKADAFLQLRKFQDKIVRLIQYVHGFRSDKKIIIAWSKPFPLCFFSPRELKLILRLSTVKNICEIHRNRFTNNLCITPAAYAIPCMALDAPRYRIAKLASHSGLSRESEKKVAQMMNPGFSGHCGSCILYSMGNCQAGCYAYVG